MKKYYRLLLFAAVLAFTGTSCATKSGCPANDAAHVQPDRKGNLPTSGGKTQLFPKDFNKKKKRRKRKN